MRTHNQIIAWLHIVFGGLYVLGGLVAWLVFVGIGGAAAASGGQEGLAVLAAFGGIGTFIMLFVLVLGLPGVIIGWGMLQHQPWARIGGILLSIINLLNVPIGTILGVYGLVILCNEETARLYQGRQPLGY